MSQFSLVTGFWENKRKYFTQILVLGDPWLAQQKGWKLKLYFGRSPLVWIRPIAGTGGSPHMQKNTNAVPYFRGFGLCTQGILKITLYVKTGRLKRSQFSFLILSSENLKKMFDFFTYILINYLVHEITKESWKNSHFASMRDGFLLRRQNSLR